MELKDPVAIRLAALARESRRVRRESQLSILFAATSILRARLAVRAARACLDERTHKLLWLMARAR